MHVRGLTHCGPGGQSSSGGPGAVRKHNKTEALRRVLRQAIADHEVAEKRKDFREVAHRIAAEARKLNTPPVTKQEMDDLWSMDELIGGD